MKVTRTHVHAIMLDGRRSALVARDGQLVALAPDDFVRGGSGRLLLTAGEVRDAGVELASTQSRFAPGVGGVVDEILDYLNGSVLPET